MSTPFCLFYLIIIMKKHLLLILAAVSILFYGCSAEKPDNIRVLQLNVWHQGTTVPNGFDAVVEQIIHADADFVTLSEVGSRFSEKLVSALKDKGKQYYSFSSEDSGILSRFPIETHSVVFPIKNGSNSVQKATVKLHDHTIVIYSAHLDYKYYACYLPRGYDGYTWKKLNAPITDVSAILQNNLESWRDEQIEAILADAKKETEQGHIIFIGGDFNEPSHRDWTEATKDSFGHNGIIVPWQSTTMLENSGFVDTYRQLFPDPLTHPGFTFPSDNPAVDVSKLTWAPEVDERERIDFVFYYPNKKLSLKNTYVFGPKSSIVKSQRVPEQTQDAFIEPKGTWPSDHKAILSEFEISR